MAVLAFSKVGAYRSVQQWLRLLGLMAATIPSVYEARLRMRPIQKFLKSKWKIIRSMGLKHLLMVPRALVSDLLWWSQEGHLQKGMPFTPPPHEFIVTTDSSMKVGWGGHMTLPSGEEALFSGTWSKKTRLETHINVLELRAIRLTLQRLVHHIQGKVVRCDCDNTSAVAYVNKQGGTRSKELLEEALELWMWALAHSVQLSAIHLPGVNNILADFLSRNRADPTEWQLLPSVCRQLFNHWGTPQVDLFASAANHQLPLWFSRHPDPEAWATDAMAQDWAGMYVYAFPPFNLIQKVLIKIRTDRAEAIFIAPFWPRTHWFNLLNEMSVGPCIRCPLRRQNRLILSQNLSGKGTLFHDDLDTLKLTAWRLTGRSGQAQGFRTK